VIAGCVRRLAARAAAHERALVATVITALSLATTWPLARDARVALPSDLGDPLLSTFILAWDADRIRHGLAGFWSAPFFFPLRDTLALSEHLLGIAVFTAPIQWLTRNPVLVYNVAFLGSYVLAGTGMYCLARQLWSRRDAAVIAAVAFAWAPHRAMHLSHVQVLMSGWMPVSLWGLHRYFETGSRRALAIGAAAFVLLGLSNGYFLYFFTLPVGAVVIAEFARRALARQDVDAPWRQRSIIDLAFAGLAVVAVFIPIAVAYLRAQSALGLHRHLGELRDFSATASDYLRVPSTLILWAERLSIGAPERSLFPGAFTACLAALACVWLIGRWAPGDASERPRFRFVVALYLSIGAVAAWLTFGPFVPGPYRALIDNLPGFAGLRVPARFTVIVALGLAVLAAGGAAVILRRLSRVAAVAVTVVITAAIVLEGYGGPLAMERFDPNQLARRQLNAWLKIGPPGGVLELPISVEGPAAFTLPYQYNTLFHGRPVVNGYSGYDSVLQRLLGGPGSPLAGSVADIVATLAGLRSIGVRFVVLSDVIYARHAPPWSPDPRVIATTLSQSSEHVVNQRHENNIWAWQLAEGPPHASAPAANLLRVTADAFRASASAEWADVRFAFDNSLATRWSTIAPQVGNEWIRIAFDRDRDIRRVEIDMGPEHPGEYPRALVIDSEAADGNRRVVFDGSVVTPLIEGIALDGRSSRIRIDLPASRSRTLVIRQTGHVESVPWTIAELRIWERQ